MKSPSILHVVRSLKRSSGAIAWSLPGLFRALDRQGLQCSVCTAQPPGPADPTDSEFAGCRVCAGPQDLPATANETFDIIHFHGFDRALAKAVLDRFDCRRVACVVSPLGALSPNPYEAERLTDRMARRWFDRTFFRKADRVLALSDAEREHIIATAGQGTVAVDVLPYGLDFEPDFGQPDQTGPKKNGRERLILLLCPIDPLDGMVEVLRGAADLGKDLQGWRVVLAGPKIGSWYEQVSAAIERKGFSERIRLLPDPDERTQRDLLAEASIVADCPLVVRAPVSSMLGMAGGARVVTTGQGMVAEMRRWAAVVSPNRDAVRVGLRNLLRQPDGVREAEALEARAQVRRRFDWSVLGERFASLYRELAGDRAARR